MSFSVVTLDVSLDEENNNNSKVVITTTTTCSIFHSSKIFILENIAISYHGNR